MRRLKAWSRGFVGVLAVLVFGPAFLAFGVFATYRFAALLWHAHEVRNWVPAVAVIESLELETDCDAEGCSKRVVCRYTYEYGGVRFTGTRVGLDDDASFEASKQHETLSSARSQGAAVTCYVNPRDPRAAVLIPTLEWRTVVFLIPFAVCFSVIGLAVIAGTGHALWSWHKKRVMQASHSDEPWRRRADWAAGVVRPRTGSDAVAVWLFCIVWNGAAWPIAALCLAEALRGTAPAITWIVAFFPAVGLVVLIRAVKVTRCHVRDGRSELWLRNVPATLGGTLEAELSLPDRGARPAAVDVQLQCVQRMGGDDESEDAVSWRSATVTCPASEDEVMTARESWAARNHRADAGEHVYPLRIAIPGDCAPSDVDGVTQWVLEVTGPRGRDGIALTFEVPVFRC